MDKEKLSSMAKAMKWIPVILGVAALLIAVASMFIKTPEESQKVTILLFALLGFMGIAIIVFGMGCSAILDAVASSQKEKADDADDIDIMA